MGMNAIKKACNVKQRRKLKWTLKMIEMLEDDNPALDIDEYLKLIK